MSAAQDPSRKLGSKTYHPALVRCHAASDHRISGVVMAGFGVRLSWTTTADSISCTLEIAPNPVRQRVAAATA